MNRVTRWAKAAVLANPWLAGKVYGAMTLCRARKAAREGGPFGQSGEDAWFLGWLRANHVQWTDGGFYIDIGANHPVVLSATYLLYCEGWRGITVDPIPSLCGLHAKMRPRDICLNVGVGSRGEIRPFWETAPDYFSSFSNDAAQEAEASGWCRILRETRVRLMPPQDIVASVPAGVRVNYLSIDTEGLDAEILGSWPWDACRPDIISCEASAERESDATRLLKEAGYSLVKTFPVTAFWRSPDPSFTVVAKP